MTLLKHTTSNQITNLNELLLTIYCFVDDFAKNILHSIRHAINRPQQGRPPTKTYNLSVSEIASFSIFKFFTGHRSWKDFYKHITTYHKIDFPTMPKYQNFLRAVNKLAPFASVLLNYFLSVFKHNTPPDRLKFADATKIKVCENKREFSHKVCRGVAKKGKSSMGWFYGFKLHIICNEWMDILGITITCGNTDDRKGLAEIWNDIFGTIVADAGYIGKNWQEKARVGGKLLFTAVKANMRKIKTETEDMILRMRQRVECVFSVLKLRMGLESTLPRSLLGFRAHYLWCITAYQLNQFFKSLTSKPLLT